MKKEDVCDCRHVKSSHFEGECETCECTNYNYYTTGEWTAKTRFEVPLNKPHDTPVGDVPKQPKHNCVFSNCPLKEICLAKLAPESESVGLRSPWIEEFDKKFGGAYYMDEAGYDTPPHNFKGENVTTDRGLKLDLRTSQIKDFIQQLIQETHDSAYKQGCKDVIFTIPDGFQFGSLSGTGIKKYLADKFLSN